MVKLTLDEARELSEEEMGTVGGFWKVMISEGVRLLFPSFLGLFWFYFSLGFCISFVSGVF